MNERGIATEALVSIASRAGVEYLIVEVTDEKALIQKANEIIWKWGILITRGLST